MVGMIVDVSLIILVVIFTAVGYFKGFLRSILSLLGTIGSGIVAFFAKDFVAGLLNSWFGWGTKIANAITSQVAEMSPSFSSVQGATGEELKTIINESNAGVVYKKLFSLIIPNDISAPSTVSEYISNFVSSLAMVIVSFIIVFIVLKIFVFILNRILKAIPRQSIVGKTNSILGVFVGFVKGLIAITVLLLLVNFLCMIPDVNNWLYPYVEQTVVTKYLYEIVGKLLL